MEEENLNLREELLVLSAKKEIKYKENYIKKASEKTLERIYEEYKKQLLHETNEMLTDVVIGKFADLLENLGWIDSAAETGKKLQGKKLFRQDVNYFVSKFSPWIPFVEILEGGICVAEDVAKKQLQEPKEEPKSQTSKPKAGQAEKQPKKQPKKEAQKEEQKE